MNNEEVFKVLINTPSPSGYEENLQMKVQNIISPFVDKTVLDTQGNLLCYKQATNSVRPKTIMLTAHIDEIGMLVRFIDENGYIRFSKLGGVDIQALKGRNVLISHQDKFIPGVIGSKPVHMKNENTKTELDISDLWIDIGSNSKNETESIIEIGDPIVIDAELKTLQNNIITGRGFDDKVGVMVLLKTMELLSSKECSHNIIAVMTVQEEVGLRGATTATFDINPDIGIAIDVAHATDYPTVNKAKHGDIRIGRGVIIPIGTDLSIQLQRRFQEIAKKTQIPYQALALPGPSGTDAHAIQISRGGCKTGLLSIPCRYMHTPVETVSICDIENAAKLLAEYCIMVES